MLRLTLFAGCFISATAAFAASEMYVSQAGNGSQFNQQFCAANRAEQHVFVLPAAVFSDEKSITCDDGESMLRTSEPADDPGHILFNIDPPAGSKESFDCDGKADVGMTTIAINCLPVGMESKMHPK